MPRGKSLTEQEKAKIEAYREENIGIREIGRRLGRSHHVIQNFLKNPNEYGKTRKKPRKSKVSERVKRKIVKTLSNSQKSLNDVKREFNLDVCRETIRQVLLRTSNIKWSKKLKAPNLTAGHVAKRLEFAKSNMNRKWEQVCCQ